MGELIRHQDIAGTDILKQTVLTGGLYFEEDNGTIRHIRQSSPRDLFASPDGFLPYAGRVDRLEYNMVTEGGDESTAKAGFVCKIHPDESDISGILHGALSVRSLPRFEIMNAHPLADLIGRREYIMPVSPSVGGLPLEGIIWMKDGREVAQKVPEAVMGMKIDLNRMFPTNPDAKTPEEAVAGIRYSTARMFVEFLRDHPSMKYLFTFHEDLEFDAGPPPGNSPNGHGHYPGGFYLYDTVRDARFDSDRKRVRNLHRQLGKHLNAAGYSMYSGIDDPGDPDLGFVMRGGYTYAPVIGRDGHPIFSRTLEHMSVELGRWGIGGVERAFCIEIPGRMTSGQKTQMVGILMESFIEPFLSGKV